MPTQPLTHHDILGLVEPFTRRGRHLDLAASQRAERRLAFKPVEHAVAHAGAESGDAPDAATALVLRETLQLENPTDGLYRLTRVLSRADGLQATLEAEGAQPAELLSLVEAVPHDRQFATGAGYEIAYSHRVDSAVRRSTDGAPPLILTQGTAHIGELTLTIAVPRMNGILADLVITNPAANTLDSLDLPEDLLAVLGWPWTRLTPSDTGWRSDLRPRGRGLARSVDAQAKFERTAAHLARTLAEPPAMFHDRHKVARWRVVARRAFPLLFTFGLVGGVAAVPKLGLASDSVWRMLLFNAPPLLMMLVFCMREMPRIEIPPLPRSLSNTSWRQVAAATEPTRDLESAR